MLYIHHLSHFTLAFCRFSCFKRIIILSPKFFLNNFFFFFFLSLSLPRFYDNMNLRWSFTSIIYEYDLLKIVTLQNCMKHKGKSFIFHYRILDRVHTIATSIWNVSCLFIFFLLLFLYGCVLLKLGSFSTNKRFSGFFFSKYFMETFCSSKYFMIRKKWFPFILFSNNLSR